MKSVSKLQLVYVVLFKDDMDIEISENLVQIFDKLKLFNRIKCLGDVTQQIHLQSFFPHWYVWYGSMEAPRNTVSEFLSLCGMFFVLVIVPTIHSVHYIV